MTSTTRQPASRRMALLASLFGAGCVILAFPTIDWAVPMLLAWVPLLVMSREWGWKRRFWSGWLMGLVYQMVIFRWIDFTLTEMTNLPGWVRLLALFLFAAWHGLFCGVFLALAEPVRRVLEGRWASSGFLGVAVVYVAIEWAWPVIFPWSVGHAFWQVSAVSSVMALTGVTGAAFMVMVVNTGLAEIWCVRTWRPAKMMGVVLIPLLIFGGAWSLHVNSEDGVRRVLRVALIQPNYPLAEKKRRTTVNVKRHLKTLEDHIRSLEPNTFDLIVAPEGAFPGTWVLKSDLPKTRRMHMRRAEMAQIGRALRDGPKTPMIIGGVQRLGRKERLRNTAVLMSAEGRIVAHYDKQILVPMGEYMPFRDVFPSLNKSVAGVSDLAAGSKPCQFEVAGEKVACGICYETIFSDFTRDNQGDASLLINLTIDTWFGTSTAPYFHIMVQSSRAVELGVPMIRSALTGISTVVAADGIPSDYLHLNEEGILTADIGMKDIISPYRAVGPVFRWLMVLISLVLLVWVFRKRRPMKKAEATVSDQAIPPDSDVPAT